MKTLTEKRSLEKLQKLKRSLQKLIKIRYEPKAADCGTCPTKGACCVDEHFVNVQITRLEAAAVRETLAGLSEAKQRAVYSRAKEAVKKYGLDGVGDSFAKTYSCPLFEKEAGCLVHENAKPAPCIQHACYENKADLPPDALLTEAENAVARLNRKAYGNAWNWLSIPVWLSFDEPED